LAYSVKSTYESPIELHESYYNQAYIGTQSDKLEEALQALLHMIDSMPRSAVLFDNSKASIIEYVNSLRISDRNAYNEFNRRLKLNLVHDPKEFILNQIPQLTFDNLEDFQQEHIQNKPRIILVIGSKDKIDLEKLKQFGTLKILDKKTVFNY
jgi:predicted Zn-dependent peptidase